MSKMIKCRNRMELLSYRISKSWRSFRLDGQQYRYFYRLYNHTWRNERAVEIPVMRRWMRACPADAVLEVGNVLSHYFPVAHDILDKHEMAPGVVNQDVVCFRHIKRYQLIVSISTLEHVGFDEKPMRKRSSRGDPDKIMTAINVLQEHLAPGGRIVFSIPIGFNPAADQVLRDGIPRGQVSCLKRVSRDNVWVETSLADALGQAYGQPYPCANGLAFVTLPSRGDRSRAE